MGSGCQPEDLGPLAVYLASDAARSMTGAILIIDGGYTLGSTAGVISRVNARAFAALAWSCKQGSPERAAINGTSEHAQVGSPLEQPASLYTVPRNRRGRATVSRPRPYVVPSAPG